MSEEKIKKALLAAGAVLMPLFLLGPFAYMILTSVNRHPGFLASGTEFTWTADNYARILTAGSLHFLDYLRNSLVISAVSALCAVAVASLAAYAIARLPIRAKTTLLLGILAVSMFPQISLISYLFKIMTGLGWINTYNALIMPYIAWILPLSLWILVSYFSQIPADLDRAALIDGCGRWHILRHIIFPLAAPGVFSTGLLAFIFAFNEFMFALMLTADHSARTVPVGIALFQGLHGEMPWGTIMAASVVTTVPVVVLTLAFQRHIIGGLTRGAVKG